MKQLSFFVVTSLIFHFLVSSTTLYWAEKLSGPRPAEITELEVLSNQPDANEQLEKTRQMIRQLKTTVEKINEIKERARFESEQTQRVAKETQAARLGLTQNSMEQALASQNRLAQNTQAPPNSTAPKETDGELPEFARPKRYQPSGPSQVSPPSSISSQLPSDISRSNATNLNTDAGTYYSFYSRVEELFYVRWVERNNYHWSRISFDYKKNVLAGRIWSTEIEVWLDADGRYHSSYIRKSSGYQLFDEATVYAFKNAGYFPNPPKAKIEPDGYVRLRYRFNVHVMR